MVHSYPVYPTRTRADLGGLWDFAFLSEKEAALPEFESPAGIVFNDKQLVPGCFDATGTYAGQRGIGIYRTAVKIGKSGKVRLEIGATTVSAKIFWDNALIAENKLAYSGVAYEFDTTAGKHELVVAVENRIDTDYNPLAWNYYDFHFAGGILRSICLYELPEGTRLGRCTVTTLDIATGKVRLDAELVNAPEAMIQTLAVAFDDAAAQPYEFSFANGVATLELNVPDFKLWSPEEPNLHTVTVSLPDGSDAITERFGIRTVETKDQKILLNGKPIYPAGYNRHEAHPEFGVTLPPAIMMEDLQILRSMNCNFVRGCHYPQDQYFLDLCDELGFMVWEESLGWGNRPEQGEREDFCALQREQTVLMVRNSRNHPCVIMWGFLNECHSHTEPYRKLIGQLVKDIKAIDTTRPTTFASMMIAYGEQCLDLVDIISCNTYPGWYGVDNNEPDPLGMIAPRMDQVIAETSTPELVNKPLLISEIGTAALAGCHDKVRRQQWTEEFQNDYIQEVINVLTERPRIQGLILWQFCDARTYVGGGALNRARGFNNKGTLDEYRREKLVADTVRHAFTKAPFNGK